MAALPRYFLEELARPRRLVIPRKLDVVTGTLAAPLIAQMAQAVGRRYPGVRVFVHPIENRFFGGNVSVAGLVTATDIIDQCKGRLHSRVLAVPQVMLQDEGDRFLMISRCRSSAKRWGARQSRFRRMVPAAAGLIWERGF